ncbi:hypothetical protein C8R42DRAFT_331328 [Lentinula raphanica]|nr:hypothetical protein C8R42DRAFT_331328 [Lentinula raphanica]
MPAPSLSIALFFCFRPANSLLTCPVSLASSINHGALAAFSLPPRLDAAIRNLDASTLSLVRTTLDSQRITVSLLTQHFEKMLNTMEVDPPAVDPPASLPSVSAPQHIEIDGHSMDIVYPAEPQPTDSVVLPGRYEDGVYYAVYQDINHLSRPELQELCKQYSLTPQGNKAVMKERLMGFSEQKIRWQCLLPGARRGHRGVREGGVTKLKSKSAVPSQSKTKKPKASTQRRSEMMGLGPDTLSNAQVFAAERSKDNRTVEEKNNLVRWAKDFCSTHPYVPREELARRRKAREEERERQKMSDSALVSGSMLAMAEQIAILNARIEALTLEHSSLPKPFRTGSVAPSQPLPTASLLPPALIPYRPALESPTGPTNLSGNNVNGVAAPTSVGRTSPPGLPASNTNENESVDKLIIGHGQIITYRYSELRQPPQISFVGKIPRLSRVWDDEHSSWDPVDCGNNLLEINGTAIALRYWPEVYRGRKGSTTWSWLKKLWNEWRYVAERYHSSGEDAFWNEFSYTDSNDKKHPEGWGVITKRLRAQREESEQQLVERAKAEYGDQFGKVFVNNRGVQLTDRPAIARRYLEELAKRS